MRLVYTTLFYAFLPLIFIRLWARGKKSPAYRKRWGERLGFSAGRKSSSQEQTLLWFHTVSVGEFIAARPLIEHYIKQSNTQVLVTTMTPTGSERVLASFGERIQHCYIPYDIPSAIWRFLKHYQPSALICLETELWPNLIHCCHKKQVPILIANARLSEKSAKGYQKVSSLTRPMLNKLTVAAIQNHNDAQRFTELGLPEHSRHVIGNIKYDLNLSDAIREDAKILKQDLSSNGEYSLFIAASTHKGEDEIILNAFKAVQKKHVRTRLILVPRHPERFDSVFELCQTQGLSCARRSGEQPKDFHVYLGDTMGELLLLLGASDIAFIGGSLIENGGHNYIEAAAWALPILTGPSTFNFQEVANNLIENKALSLCGNEHELSEAILGLLKDQTQAQAMGLRGLAVAEQNRGALSKLISLIDTRLNLKN